MPLPALRKGGRLERASQQVSIGLIRGLERDHVGYRHTPSVASGDFETIAGRDLTLAHDRKVETGSAALKESLDHVVPAEPDSQLEAWHAWLRHHELDRADADAIAYGDVRLENAGCRQVFAERCPGQRDDVQFPLPVVVVLGRIGIDGLGGPAMN